MPEEWEKKKAKSSVVDVVIAIITLAEGIARGQSTFAQRIELKALAHT